MCRVRNDAGRNPGTTRGPRNRIRRPKNARKLNQEGNEGTKADWVNWIEGPDQ